MKGKIDDVILPVEEQGAFWLGASGKRVSKMDTQGKVWS